jgi:hypothetical protein
MPCPCTVAFSVSDLRIFQWEPHCNRVRALREQGHEVQLIPAQYVKPYVRANKSDYIDAEAIAEAVARSTMRFVPIKTDDQLDLPSNAERWGFSRLVHYVR